MLAGAGTLGYFAGAQAGALPGSWPCPCPGLGRDCGTWLLLDGEARGEALASPPTRPRGSFTTLGPLLSSSTSMPSCPCSSSR
jgi:hypothetical protein